ncbi:hypothetical protein K2X33_08770 [bacterium]|nr:hypothetical protein [bacterium]
MNAKQILASAMVAGFLGASTAALANDGKTAHPKKDTKNAAAHPKKDVKKDGGSCKEGGTCKEGGSCKDGGAEKKAE